MKGLITKGQMKMLSDFSSNFSIAWLAASLIATSLTTNQITQIQMAIGLLNSVGAFMISFVLARKL